MSQKQWQLSPINLFDSDNGFLHACLVDREFTSSSVACHTKLLWNQCNVKCKKHWLFLSDKLCIKSLTDRVLFT